MDQLEERLKVQRDLKNVIDTAFSEGVKHATENAAIYMLKLGLELKIISNATGLSENEINVHP